MTAVQVPGGRLTDSATIANSGAAQDEIAHAFVGARREARALSQYPGEIPHTLEDAYAVQQAALALWPDRPVGWKVGKIADDLAGKLGAGRLIGPIFMNKLWPDMGEPMAVPVFAGGFAAVEGEFVLRIGQDADPAKADWTADEARDLCDGMFIGVEIASSPLATINDLGPTVVVSDFGNNAGLILGEAIPDWREISPDSLAVETFVEGVSVGTGKASGLPGGPFAAVAFLLSQLARMKRPAKSGDLVSTGAVSGIHNILPGQSARVKFGDFGEILCKAEAARPEAG